MSIEERVKAEIKEKKEQISKQIMNDIRSYLMQEKIDYQNFMGACPQSGRYLATLAVGILIGLIL